MYEAGRYICASNKGGEVESRERESWKDGKEQHSSLMERRWGRIGQIGQLTSTVRFAWGLWGFGFWHRLWARHGSTDSCRLLQAVARLSSDLTALDALGNMSHERQH